MPTLTLNGQSVDFEGRPTILQVALEQGVELPHYCYHEGLSIVASCRICLAEVAAPNPRNENKVELMPKLVPTCQTPASDGMVVYTKSPKAIA
ncbi:MAG: 2Fe-2S iron-sulfur cluster-binding protein, partial [Phycisphaeraceae bacterium]|nr:2Fe-2S iron-sulfur cluster-binding protein [Phycisphaeraceae bacterium]